MDKFKEMLVFIKENKFEILFSLLYLIIAFIPQVLFYCFTDDCSVMIVSVVLLFAIIFGKLFQKQEFQGWLDIGKIDKWLDKCINNLPLFLFILIGALYFILRAINSPVVNIIDILGNELILWLDSPYLYCKFICCFLKKNIECVQLIVFFIIALIPLYSICKIASKIVNLWSKKEKHNA